MSIFMIGTIVYENDIRKIRILNEDTLEVMNVDKKYIIENLDIKDYRDTNLYDYINADEDDIRFFNLFMPSLYEDSSIEEFREAKAIIKRLNNGDMVVTNMLGEVRILKENEFNPDDYLNCYYEREYGLLALNGVYIEPQEHENTEMENNIKEKYNNFINKCKLMGLDNTFEYKIEDEDVILVNYTGKSDKVIVPGFITIIGEQSFSAYARYSAFIRISEIRLNEGLKRICTKAFSFCQVENIVIPSTVEVIEKLAFYNSSITLNTKDSLDISKIILLNSNTKIE